MFNTKIAPSTVTAITSYKLIFISLVPHYKAIKKPKVAYKSRPAMSYTSNSKDKTVHTKIIENMKLCRVMMRKGFLLPKLEDLI